MFSTSFFHTFVNVFCENNKNRGATVVKKTLLSPSERLLCYGIFANLQYGDTSLMATLQVNRRVLASHPLIFSVEFLFEVCVDVCRASLDM